MHTKSELGCVSRLFRSPRVSELRYGGAQNHSVNLIDLVNQVCLDIEIDDISLQAPALTSIAAGLQAPEKHVSLVL